MNIRNSLILSMLCLVAGCVATGEIFEPAADPKANQALLYIYRPSAVTAIIFSPRTAVIGIDGNPVAELNGGGYTYVYLNPGAHKLSQYWRHFLTDKSKPLPQDPKEITVNLMAGRKYYVEILAETASTGEQIQSSWSFTEVPEAHALQKLPGSKYKGNEITNEPRVSTRATSTSDTRFNERERID